MQLTTPITIEKPPFGIGHRNKVMLIGSCFTENIGNRLAYHGFNTLTNPCGILYNPISIAQCLDRTLEGNEIGESDLVFGGGLWHSWQHHGKFSHPDKAVCLQNCNNALHEAHDFLQHTDTLILTFGTAFVYNLSDGTVVANCHKMPGTLFDKRMFSTEELIICYNALIDKLLKKMPNLRIILTVSPIRHWKDGYRQNTLSKATLHLLANELEQAHTNITYFPAYEIVMDELRDYRFYDTDLLHPSPTAVEYIWERFSDTYFDEPTKTLCQKVAQWRKMSQHRPLFPESAEYKAFTQKLKQMELELKSELPDLQ